ncbi:MAG: pyrroline-5-carboxylate reductase [Oligoflexia bacterium]|nr:pyrroline-5-carboxylate reductase [Oligoflexia bacterium]
MSFRWGFVGCGNLAQAIIGGALKTDSLLATQVSATNRSQSKLKKFANATSINICVDNQKLLMKSDVIVLATKPQDLCSVLEEIAPFITSKHIVISLAAGVTANVLKKHLSSAKAIFRVMANTPAVIQKGLYGIYRVKGKDEDFKTVSRVFEKIGTIVTLKNDKEINAMTAGAASGTGFVLQFMQDFEKWFVKKGYPRSIARKVAVETFLGTSSLAQQRQEQSLEELRDAVTSKKGTTFAGLTSMKKSKVSPGIQKALQASYSRSFDIAKNLRPNRK